MKRRCHVYIPHVFLGNEYQLWSHVPLDASFGRCFLSQSLGLVLKKLNVAQQKQTKEQDLVILYYSLTNCLPVEYSQKLKLQLGLCFA